MNEIKSIYSYSTQKENSAKNVNIAKDIIQTIFDFGAKSVTLY